jgi:hypothetical protein
LVTAAAPSRSSTMYLDKAYACSGVIVKVHIESEAAIATIIVILVSLSFSISQKMLADIRICEFRRLTP